MEIYNIESSQHASDGLECGCSLSSDDAVLTFQINKRVNLPKLNSRFIKFITTNVLM